MMVMEGLSPEVTREVMSLKDEKIGREALQKEGTNGVGESL